jgi:hypothetical protein
MPLGTVKSGSVAPGSVQTAEGDAKGESAGIGKPRHALDLVEGKAPPPLPRPPP